MQCSTVLRVVSRSLRVGVRQVQNIRLLQEHPNHHPTITRSPNCAASSQTLFSKVRLFSTECCGTPPNENEQRMINKLKEKFPKATEIHVHDISGGCGSMYEVHIMADEFRGVRTVAQHRMVNEALKDDIKTMHGLRISTMAPE